MSFFKKLKERMFRSSDKIGEGLEALVAEGAEGPKDPPREVPERAPELPEPLAPELPEPDLPELPEPVEPEPDLPMPEDPMPMDRGQVAAVVEAPEPAKPGLLGRLFGRAAAVEEPRRVLDDAMLESLEELLIQADMGVDTAVRVTANIAEGRFGRKMSTRELRAALAGEVARIMEPVARPMPLYAQKPQVVLVVGVNGSGKTTTIGKLASQFKAAGKTVVIAAGDTFRAAAVEQLQIWGQRAGVPVLTAPEGSDPASLAFDALTKARADGADLLMIDTAGRLQNRQDLMEELAKIVRVIRKVDPTAPHNTLLVLDATTGQNAVTQVDIFRKIADVSGLVMTKLDGTAKGGVLVALADKFGLPIHAIGVGEQIDDLAPFDPEEFARALVGAEGVIRAGLFALTLAGPAAAEGLVNPALCVAVWDRLSDTLRGAMPSSGQVTQMDGDWCVIEAPVFALDGAYPLVWQADRLRLRGSALGWVMDGTTSPTTLELEVENLRAVVQIGSPQMDWLYAAQARANTIDADLALSWDSAGRVLRLDRLEIDFPGDNLIEASAKVGQVDLSSLGAAQMSLASFAVTEVDLQVRTHGLFEWYMLMTLGPSLLPEEGDMEAAAEALRDRIRSGVAGLPGEVFPEASKAALLALTGELPNPSGDLSVSVRSDAGIGPARLSGYALSGMSETVWETGDLLDGATVDVGWTHTDAP